MLYAQNRPAIFRVRGLCMIFLSFVGDSESYCTRTLVTCFDIVFRQDPMMKYPSNYNFSFSQNEERIRCSRAQQEVSQDKKWGCKRRIRSVGIFLVRRLGLLLL